jgi:two-component system, chemotaxis family, sensor kinase CheA
MAKDPYRYFRVEAAELLDNLTRGVLELEKGSAEKGMVASLLRLAHTLKGASQVVKQPGIAQAAHTVEDILGPYRENEAPPPKDRTGAILRLLDQIGANLATLDAPPSDTPARSEAPHQVEISDTLRVDLEEMDELLGNLSEASVDLTAIQGEAGTLRRAHHLSASIFREVQGTASGPRRDNGNTRSIADELTTMLALSERRISAGLERLQRELGLARDRADRLRLQSAQTIFSGLGRAAREAAAALGKQIQFETGGGDVRLDGSVISVLRDALLHLVRNAVAHGIESAEHRRTAGKPAAGKVTIEAQRVGRRVSFRCRDDGRGLDLAAIRRAAVNKGAISESQAGALSLDEAVDLIFKGGLSTSTVTRISGRGLGLDVVRDAVARLKGDIRVETESGQGTTIEICVPISMASVLALMAETAGVTVAIPLDAVRSTMRLSRAEIADAGTGHSIVYDGQAIKFCRLSAALGSTLQPNGGAADRTAVIVRSSSGTAAFGVRRLLGTNTILVRAIPSSAAVDPVIAGATLDGRGNPLLVADPDLLVTAAQRASARTEQSASGPRPPILVIDDSLTTRMVEQSVLESAGHLVECACSAEEAIEKAHQRRYSLFLVDVEMPAMDGFQFVSMTHSDPLLRETPSILVTSRSSPADRRRGEEVGARAYIVKSEFDQTRFLETIRQLVA